MRSWKSWLVLWLLVVVQAAATFTLILAFAHSRTRGPLRVGFLVLMTALLVVSATVVLVVRWHDRER